MGHSEIPKFWVLPSQLHHTRVWHSLLSMAQQVWVRHSLSECDTASLSMVQPSWVWRRLNYFSTGILFEHIPCKPRPKVIQLFRIWLRHTQKSCTILREAVPYSERLCLTQIGWAILKRLLEYGAAGWVIPKIWEFQNVPKYFRIHLKLPRRAVIHFQWIPSHHAHIKTLLGLVTGLYINNLG